MAPLMCYGSGGYPQACGIFTRIFSRPANALNIDNNEHCLILTRRTWVRGRVVTYCHLYHPALRFQFESMYKP